MRVIKYNSWKYRFWNISDNKEYTSLINKGIRVYEREKLSPTEKINEYILTTIRTSKGIDQIDWSNKGWNPRKKVEKW